nr:MAG TPA: replication gene A protein [Caudoviricetes sp.]
MAQTLRIKTAGGLTKLSLSPRIKKSDGYQTRREKKKISTAAQKYVNAKAQHDQLEFLLAANVRPGDWFVTLTYDDQHLPDCWDRADKNMQWFFRKLRESRRPAKTIYFYNIERAHWSDDPGCCHRWHHHAVIPQEVAPEAIQQLWGRGHVDMHPIILDRDHTYGSLATYLLKESSEFPGKRGWRSSKGLAKPEVDCMVVDDDYVIPAPEGEAVMVLDNPGPQLTVYGKFQVLKFQALDGYDGGVLSSKHARRRRSPRRRAAAHGAD